jgi:cysteinyl-tRNA synthetase
MLGAHYRSPIEFSEERLREAARALETFARLFHDARAAAPGPALSEEVAAYRARFIEAMDDDFNTPQAVGVLFTLADALSKRLVGASGAAVGEVAAGVEELRRLGRALGLFEQGYETVEAPSEVLALVEQRQAARSKRDWKRADALRDEILSRGWAVEDTPAGPRVAPRGA